MKQEIFEKKEQLSLEYSCMRDWMNRTSCSDAPIWKNIGEEIFFYRVKGIVSDSSDAKSFEALYSALLSLQIGFCVVFKISEGKLDAYFGCSYERLDVLKGMLNRVVGFSLSEETYEEQNILEQEYLYESLLVGDAVYPEDTEKNVTDVLMSYKFYEDICIVLSVTPLSRKYVNDLSYFFGVNQSKLQELTSRQITDRDDRETISYAEDNGDLKCFLEVCERYAKKFSKQSGTGVFFDTIKIFSNSRNAIDIATGTYVSQACVEEYPEVLRPMSLDDVEVNTAVATNMKSLSINGLNINLPVYSNIHTEEEVAFFLSFPRLDTLGLFHREIPHFDIEREYTSGLCLGDIKKNGESVSKYYLPFEELNRNALVSGLVGSGKTNTIEHLLKTLNERGIPFFVVEPVKTEYYELKNEIKDLKIISVGSLNNGLELNPFEPVSDEVSLQKHVDALYSAIMAAFEWVPPMPQIVEKVIYRVYSDNGFDVANNIRNPKGNYPTIEQAYWTIRTVVKEEKFDTRMESDLIGCIGARFHSLRVGNKGRTLNVRKSMPMRELFESNCVIELEEIQDEEIRSFIIGLLLANLREYCMLRRTSHLGIQHCTVIEEAHTLLRKIDSSSSAAQAKGVKVFSEMIKTLRAKGESFIIVDQVPTELADDVVKNTNLKIVHRMVAADDKSILARTMNCTEEQEEFITALTRGEAVVFSEGDYRPKMVKVPFVDIHKEMTREEILRISKIPRINDTSLYDVSPACLYCENYELCQVESNENQFPDNERIGIWMDKASELSEVTDFEDLCIEIMVYLKRHNADGLVNCIIKRVLDSMNLSIQEKHEMYSVYLRIQKESSIEE